MERLTRRRVKVDFADFWHPDEPEEIRRNPLYRLLSRRFDLEISRDPDFLLYSCFGDRFRRTKCIRIYYTGENLRPNWNDCDFAFSFDYPVTQRNYRLPLYALYDGIEDVLSPRDPAAIVPLKTKFCNFLYTAASCAERSDFFQRLCRYKRVDSGGGLHNNLGYGVPQDETVAFRRPYKFTIAFENASHPGYTTEKIFQAFHSQTVPIYWGNPRVEEDFNPRAFINCHRFRSFDEAIEHVIEVDRRDDLLAAYLAEPPFVGNRLNPFVDEKNVLDRFESIFAEPGRRPVARTLRGRYADTRRKIRQEYLRPLYYRIRGFSPP